MASLLNFLRQQGFNPYLVTNPDSFPLPEFRHTILPEINDDTNLIIRDSRDSSSSQISLLKKIAPVIAIDDLGEGRADADLAIDLLPNLVYTQREQDSPFIYGYSFTKAIHEYPQLETVKDIDFCVYAGFGASAEYVSFLKDILPYDSRSVILDGVLSVEIMKGKTYLSALNYPKTAVSSKNFISHFGISLFEGNLCNCKTFSINPTGYHSKLADLAGPLIGTENFGVYSDFDLDSVKNRLKEAASVQKRSIRIAEVRDQIDFRLNRFYEKIKPFI
jgi:hypothetical protein